MKLVLFLCTLLFSFNCLAQNKWFNTKEDYYEHQEQVEKGLKDWLSQDPTVEDNTVKQLRALLEVYLFAWIQGAPHIKIILDGKLESDVMADKKYEYAQELFKAFLFAKILYLIQHPDAQSENLEANVAAVEGMLQVYQTIQKSKTNTKGKIHKKALQKQMEAYRQAKQNDTLQALIKQKLLN